MRASTEEREVLDMRERTYKINGHEAYLQDFDGINEFADYIKNTPTTKPWLRDDTIKELTGGGRYSEATWKGAHNFAEAESGLRDGLNVREIARAREGSLTTERRALGRGVCGGSPIVPAYLTGNPQSMMTLKPRKERKKIRVFVDCAMPAVIDGDEMREAGEKIVGVLAKLDAIVNYDLAAGCVVIDGWGDKSITGFGVTIKTAGKPFSASRVSFCLTSPAFRRVFGFIWNSKTPAIDHRISGMGQSLTHDYMSLYKKLMNMHHKDTVIIPLCQILLKTSSRGGSLVRRSSREADEYIKNIFKEAGIEL